MRKISLLLLLIVISIQSYSQTKNFIDKPYITTISTVDTLVVPDKIYLSILITEKDTRGKVSVEELENRMNTKLISLGIDTKKQLSLSDVASNFKNYLLRKKDVLKNKAYTLLVFDAETAGKVMVGLESIEISNVQLDKTEYSKIEQLKIELKQKAVSKAITQAKFMLKPLNQNLGKAIFISDSYSNYSRAQGNVSDIRIRGYSSINKEQYDPIAIEFEKIEIKSTITVNFEIE